MAHIINQHVRRVALTQVFNELSVSSWSSISALNECIGDIDEDHSNSIMEAEMKSQRGDEKTGEASHRLSQSLPSHSKYAYCQHGLL